jgi:uncharacterized repeat protein (TIGR03803 family)
LIYDIPPEATAHVDSCQTKNPVKNKLKLSALITFVLAAAPRLEAATIFVNLRDLGGPVDLSFPSGGVAEYPPGNIIFAGGTGDPTHYFGGFGELSGVGPGGDWNNYGSGNITYSIPYTFGQPGDIWYPCTTVAVGDFNGDGTLEMAVGASGGAANGVGGVEFFSVTPTGIIPQATFSLIAINGTDPNGLTMGPDGSLFLTCATGGNGYGTVYKVKVLHHDGIDELTGDLVLNCNGANGGNGPRGAVAFSPNGGTSQIVQKTGTKTTGAKANANTVTNYTVYGVTFFGGTNGAGPGTGGYGTVYKINNDSSGFQTLYVFSGQVATNGYGPAGGMALSGNTLYGTTSGGGANDAGAVFKIDTSGSNFMVLKSFSAWGTEVVNGYYNYTNSDGMGPEGDLILSGDTLYGTSFEGGTNGGGGVVFSINTNGNNFTVLHSFSSPVYDTNVNSATYGAFTNSGGGGTRAGVVLSGHVLFGTTPYGGKYGGGTVFAIILPSPPALNIAPAGGNFAVSWPSSATNFMLQRNLTLNSLTWSNFNGAVNDNGTNKSVSIIPAAGSAFFRLLNTNGP